jgi:glycosyltransferase involved in cell wall biosynthesis
LGSEYLDVGASAPSDVVTIYHPVTLAGHFDDPQTRFYAELGREQLRVLARRSKVGMATSNFGRREMLKAGFHRVEVLPPRTTFPAFSGSGESGRERSGDWLFVGSLVASNRHHLLVRAFAHYLKTIDGSARLLLAGDVVHVEYAARVRSEAHQLGVADRVALLGRVSDAELRVHYAEASVFVSLGEHQGFGVPLVEAMASRLPVVAYAGGAVAETMGGAGILLRSDEPALVAATVQSIRSDSTLRDRLVARQLVRVRQVEAFDTTALLELVIRKAEGQERSVEVQVQGPIETSYSLAVVNRNLALGLEKRGGYSVSVYATEGPGDYEPDPAYLATMPEIAQLLQRSANVPYPDVAIRQMWPPRVLDSNGAITCEYFGWEESRVPQTIVDDFNVYLDGIGVMSNFVKAALIDSGVTVPLRVVGCGVECPDPLASVVAPEVVDLRSFRFVNIGSAFPRKGLDILLEAYFSAFDASSDVSLVLKTFPNPHNRVGEILEDLYERHPNPPDVRWIDRDMSQSEIHGLYNLATCYVHPSRGEGFGLPVAEAMLARVPVISPAHSGLADFVSEETAITVPYRIELARTHFDVPGSTWAEPYRDALAASMKRMVERPDDPAVSERVRRAHELIESRYSWTAVVARWVDLLEYLEGAAREPRVAMVSTWNSRCGIAENTRSIVGAANDFFGYEIYANDGVEVLDLDSEWGVVRCWTSVGRPELTRLEAALDLSSADVVHVQFNFGFFDLSHLAELIERELERRAVVMSLHRTRDIEISGVPVSLSAVTATLKRVDQLIVHQPADVRVLAEMGVVDNVRVIPLGCPAPPPVTAAEARAALGLDDRPVIATFGFLLPHKGILELLDVLNDLRSDNPQLHLMALCALHPDPSSAEFEAEVRQRIADLNLESNVTLITEYLPELTARTILRASDVIALPYRQTEESASSALRFVLPAERPIVATNLPIFADAAEALVLVEPGNKTMLTDVLRRLLQESIWREDLARQIALAVHRYSWPGIVAEHRQVYELARARYARRAARLSRVE